MVLGLGTGSTAKHAVDRIAQLLQQGKLKDIVGIPTSTITHEQAVRLGIPLSDLDSHPVVDLAIDGADEIGHASGGYPILLEPFAEETRGLVCLCWLRWELRKSGDGGQAYVTDNGNYIIDLYFERDIGDLNKASDAILRLPGIVEHGMFIGLATSVIVAGVDGITVKTKVGNELKVESLCYNDLRNGF
ncbi:UNVERIFIED_CONTAM: putative ribose-5-phosphate isomerase 1 [Sesamum angustifolium]|uniref:ribose-5-phosphate isomerase n=1 Tax=Sesamum angustifolium TaxID=2727405 RepID=A0AAW2RLI1_9LAMI